MGTTMIKVMMSTEIAKVLGLIVPLLIDNIPIVSKALPQKMMPRYARRYLRLNIKTLPVMIKHTQRCLSCLGMPLL